MSGKANLLGNIDIITFQIPESVKLAIKTQHTKGVGNQQVKLSMLMQLHAYKLKKGA